MKPGIKLTALAATLVYLGCTTAFCEPSSYQHIYTIRQLAVQDSKAHEHLWMIDQFDPYGNVPTYMPVFISLSSPEVLAWLDTLPAGSTIQYHRPGLPRTSFRPRVDYEAQVEQFKSMCEQHYIKFDDKFPVL